MFYFQKKDQQPVQKRVFQQPLCGETLRCFTWDFSGTHSRGIQGLGHVTSDKQTPSAIDYLGHMKEAVSVEKRLQKPPHKPLKDLLNGLVATYNKMTTSKRHRIETGKKSAIYNLWLNSSDLFGSPNNYDLLLLHLWGKVVCRSTHFPSVKVLSSDMLIYT